MDAPGQWLVRNRGTGARIGLALAAVAVTSIFFINLCDWIYECGCRSIWSGAAAHCNIHTAGAKHCPWCSIGTLGAGAVWAAIAGVQCWVALRSGITNWIRRCAYTLAAFPIVGWLLGIAIGLATGYWS